MTSSFSLAVRPALQDTDCCSACSHGVVDRKNRAGSLMDKLFIGQKESEGWDSVSTEGTNGREEGHLCPHAVSTVVTASAQPAGLLLRLADPHPTFP